MSHPDNLDTCIILPSLNERENLEELIPQLSSYTIFVIDDGSTDGTVSMCKNFDNVRVIERGYKQGLVSAVLDGFRASKDSFENMVVMDADLSHNPAYIAKMINTLKNSKADLLIGSRYVKGGSSHDKALRKCISFGANTIFKLAFSRNVKDATSGFRIYTREAAQFILNENQSDPISNSYAGQIDILRRLISSGFRMVEFPISFVPRKEGESKLCLSDMKQYAQLASSKGHLKRYFTVAILGLVLNQMTLSAFPFASIQRLSIISIGLIMILGLSINNDRNEAGHHNRIASGAVNIYNRYAGPAIIAVLTNLIVFLALIKYGFYYPAADFIGIVCSIAIIYGFVP